MDDRRKLFLALGALVAIGIAAMGIRHLLSEREASRRDALLLGAHDPSCVSQVLKTTGGDVVMRGVIVPGTDLRVHLGYYRCNPVKAGEVVLYRFSERSQPVMRIVRAAPGDRFKVARASRPQRGWNLKVNGSPVMFEGKPYFFGAEAEPPLALYEKPSGGKLGPKELILLSAVAPGLMDSGSFGVVSVDDLIGRVVLPGQK